MLKEFKAFALRGNVIDMTIGIVVGASFGDLVKSFIKDVFMPPIGLLLGRVDFADLYINLTTQSFASLAEAEAAGAPVIKYGLFFNNLLHYVIVAFVVFALIRWVVRQEPEAAD